LDLDGNDHDMCKIPGQDVASVRISSLTTCGLLVPLSFMLGTSAAIARAAPLLLADIAMQHGIQRTRSVIGHRAAGDR
jgi:hypothetical protein